MPGMNGSQFVRELRKFRPHLPVMVISGLEEAEPEYAGMNVRFLLKPLHPICCSPTCTSLAPSREGAA